jgi:hypothetical protein
MWTAISMVLSDLRSSERPVYWPWPLGDSIDSSDSSPSITDVVRPVQAQVVIPQSLHIQSNWYLPALHPPLVATVCYGVVRESRIRWLYYITIYTNRKKAEIWILPRELGRPFLGIESQRLFLSIRAVEKPLVAIV